MNKLILIEGIPGSGKTTISKKVKDYLISKGKKTILFNEGDLHPADLAWIASVPISDYNELLKHYPEHSEKIQENTQLSKDFAYVAYTKLGMYPGENELMKRLEQYEVYNGRVSLELFSKFHLNRWESFGNLSTDDTIMIFECSFLQNHVNELLAYHTKDDQYITRYLVNLMSTVKQLNPKLIYLSQPDIRETIHRVSKERLVADKSKGKDWIELVIEYIEQSPYGKSHDLKGFEGVISYFEHRKELELKVIEALEIEKVIIENRDYNWDKVVEDVLINI